MSAMTAAKRAAAARLLAEAQQMARRAERSAAIANFFGHFLNFFSGFFEGLTFTYKPTLNVLYNIGAVDSATYHQLLHEPSRERTAGKISGAAVGLLAGGVLKSGAAFLDKTVAFIAIAGRRIALTGRLLFSFINCLLKQANSMLIDHQ